MEPPQRGKNSQSRPDETMVSEAGLLGRASVETRPSLTVGLLTPNTSHRPKKELDTSFSQTPAVERAPVVSAVEGSKVILLLDRIVFYGLMALIALTAIPYASVHPWSHAAFECSVFLLTLLWIMHGLLAGTWLVGNLRLILPIAALVGLAVVQSLVWSQVDWAGIRVGYSLSADPFESWVFVFRTSALVLAALLLI